MIELSKVYCLDLADDLEAIGMKRDNFDIYDLIQGDESRAFALGYCFDKWCKEGAWFSPKSRKQLRHASDDIDSLYNKQLDWINKKYGSQPVLDYVNCVMDNLFFENENHRIRVALLLGKSFSDKKLYDE